jgi:hypothetical protein
MIILHCSRFVLHSGLNAVKREQPGSTPGLSGALNTSWSIVEAKQDKDGYKELRMRYYTIILSTLAGFVNMAQAQKSFVNCSNLCSCPAGT